VLNRGNGRAEVFPQPGDYGAFLALIAAAQQRVPMRLLGYCLMPNHFHLVVWPGEDGELSRWMHWLMTAHVRRYRKQYRSSGHVWQGRFKAFPIQEDEHLLTVMRYIERNPLRAGLVERGQDWPWSSLSTDETIERPALDPGPVPRACDWVDFVNRPMTDAEADAMKLTMRRDRPFGSETWTRFTAKRLGLQFTLRPPWRPKAAEK
jgi:putative transposase